MKAPYEMRFKTKKEVIKEFGSYEQFLNSTYWIKDMDYLFGTPLNKYTITDYNVYYLGNGFQIEDHQNQYEWIIQSSMVTPIAKKEEKVIEAKPVIWVDQTSKKEISITYAVSGYDTKVIITYEDKVFIGKAHRRKNEPNIPAVGFSLALARAADKAIKVLGQIPIFYNVDTGEVK